MRFGDRLLLTGVWETGIIEVCVWAHEFCFAYRFVKIIGCDVFTSFFQPGLIQGASILYNLTRIGPHNIVIATKKEEDLPHWLVSAMKCLSNCKIYLPITRHVILISHSIPFVYLQGRTIIPKRTECQTTPVLKAMCSN